MVRSCCSNSLPERLVSLICIVLKTEETKIKLLAAKSHCSQKKSPTVKIVSKVTFLCTIVGSKKTRQDFLCDPLYC
jgi:hypothetical protein